MPPTVSEYDPYVDELADYTGRREQRGVAGDQLLLRQLELLGEVAADLSQPLPGEEGCSTRWPATLLSTMSRTTAVSSRRSPLRSGQAAGWSSLLTARTARSSGYLHAFIDAGLRLTKLADLPAHSLVPGPDSILAEGGRFPRFMLMAFVKP
jgi:hypothetical protein